MTEFARTVRMPCCGKIVDRHSQFIADQDKEIPREGDITICARCGEIGVYTENLDVRVATHDELFEIHMSRMADEIDWLQNQIKQRNKSKQ